jgi:hypothetical protein
VAVVSLPPPRRSVPRIDEGVDDAIIAIAIAPAMPNFIAFFITA